MNLKKSEVWKKMENAFLEEDSASQIRRSPSVNEKPMYIHNLRDLD